MRTYEVRLNNIRGEIFDRIDARTINDAAEQAAMRLYGAGATARRLTGIYGGSSGLFQPQLTDVTWSWRRVDTGKPLHLSELKERA